MFIAAQFTIAECWKQPKSPSVNEWMKNCGTFWCIDYYAAERKKERTLTFCDSMGGTGGYYAK